MKIKSMPFTAGIIALLVINIYYIVSPEKKVNLKQQSLSEETEHLDFVEDVNLVIDGILYSEDKPAAIIKGSIAHEGDTVQGKRILHIYENEIELEQFSKVWRQQVNEPVKNALRQKCYSSLSSKYENISPDSEHITERSMEQTVGRGREHNARIVAHVDTSDDTAGAYKVRVQALKETYRNSQIELPDYDSESSIDARKRITTQELPSIPRIGVSDYSNNPRLGQKTKRGTYLGQLGGNEFNHNSTRNPFGAGNEFSPYSIKNDFGKYGNELSPYSARNPFATNAPKLYDSQGNYRGKLSSNPYLPDSISNPYGRYGNQFSHESINNPFGAGNPFTPDSHRNSFGRGLSIYGDD